MLHQYFYYHNFQCIFIFGGTWLLIGPTDRTVPVAVDAKGAWLFSFSAKNGYPVQYS